MSFPVPSPGFASPVPAVTQIVLTATITASSTQNTLAAVQTTITPSGGSVYTYAGTLSVPTGSSTALDSATIANPTFTPDKAGVYTVTLTATDTASGATVTKVRTQEVGTAALSVSIAAISNQLTATGTINCDSTASGAVGSVTYAWTGTKPDGTAASFSDATAADPTITLSASDRAGVYSVTVTATDAAGRTATATTTFRVGSATGWVTARNIDYTDDANATISSSPFTDEAGIQWTVGNVANASTFAVVNGTGLRIIANASVNITAAVRQSPSLSAVLSTLASMYAEGRKLGVHIQLGTGSAIGASQRQIYAVFEDPTTPIGDGGSTERGGGVTWRNNAGTLQIAGMMMGLSSGSGLVMTARAQTANAPRVMAFERSDWGVRVGYSTNTAAFGDPDHASWSWAEPFGVDYTSTASKLVPSTDQLTIAAATNAGGAGAQIDVEKLWVGVQR